MKKEFIFVSLSLALVLLSGCATKVQVRTLQPAEITTKSKTVVVAGLVNDRVNLSGKIEAKLSNQVVDGQNYFRVLSPQELDHTPVEAIISGAVSNPSSSDSYFYETRSRCNKDRCWEIAVSCVKRISALSAEIKMVDAQSGGIIYADTFDKSMVFEHCQDDSTPLFSPEMASQQIAQNIADSFIYKLVPHYVYFDVEILDKPDMDYSDTQKNMLSGAIEYIKLGRYDKAQQVLDRLIDTTDEKSYVALYDQGVLKEAQGDYSEAQVLYNKADNVAIKPIALIGEAIGRIQNSILENQQARQQIGR